MKKEFINPELEVLRFQNGADVLLTSGDTPGVSNSPAIGSDQPGGKSLSRGMFDNSVD